MTLQILAGLGGLGLTLSTRVQENVEEFETKLTQVYEATDGKFYRAHPCFTLYIAAGEGADVNHALYENDEQKILEAVHEAFSKKAGEFEQEVCSMFDHIDDLEFGRAVKAMWVRGAAGSADPLGKCAGDVADIIANRVAAKNDKSLMDFCEYADVAEERIVMEKDHVPSCGDIIDTQGLVAVGQELTCNLLKFGIMKTRSPSLFLPLFTDVKDEDLLFRKRDTDEEDIFHDAREPEDEEEDIFHDAEEDIYHDSVQEQPEEEVFHDALIEKKGVYHDALQEQPEEEETDHDSVEEQPVEETFYDAEEDMYHDSVQQQPEGDVFHDALIEKKRVYRDALQQQPEEEEVYHDSVEEQPVEETFYDAEEDMYHDSVQEQPEEEVFHDALIEKKGVYHDAVQEQPEEEDVYYDSVEEQPVEEIFYDAEEDVYHDSVQEQPEEEVYQVYHDSVKDIFHDALLEKKGVYHDEEQPDDEQFYDTEEDIYHDSVQEHPDEDVYHDSVEDLSVGS